MFILYAAVKLVTALCNCKEIKKFWNCSQRPIMIITRVCVNKKWFSISTHYFIDKKGASATYDYYSKLILFSINWGFDYLCWNAITNLMIRLYKYAQMWNGKA